MRYLRKYDTFLESVEEQKIINDILSTNESLINEGMIDKLKNYAKKGLLTATILAGLMSNPAFAKEYKSLPNEEKQKIESSIKYNKEEDKGVFDLSKSFKSGVWKLDEQGKKDLNIILERLVDHINSFKNPNLTSFDITIIARESTLKNYDAETKKKLEVGELARLRAEEVEKYVLEYLKSYNVVPISINIDSAVEEGKDYENHQYVKLKIEPTVLQKDDFCNFNLKVSKDKVVNNIALDTIFDVKDKLGSGYVTMDTGSIPDRIVIYADNKLIGDSGFFATSNNAWFGDKWEYTPANILALTNLYRSKSKAISDANLDIRKFENFDELIKEMSKSKSVISTKSNYPDDIDNAIDELRKLFKAGVRDFVFYKIGKVKINFDLQGKYEKIQVIVYTPRGKSDFTVKTNCSSQIQKKTP